MSTPALTPKPLLWKLRGTWYCALVIRGTSVLSGSPPLPMLDEPIGTGATPGEAGTVWRLVKHGRRYQAATASPAP